VCGVFDADRIAAAAFNNGDGFSSSKQAGRRYRSLAALGPGRSPSPPASDGRDQPDTRYLIEWVTALCVAAYCLKVKNPIAPAVKREAEEDWGRSAERRE
jgi:hypothetical protein